MPEQTARTSWDQQYSEGSHALLDPDIFLIEAVDQFVQSHFPAGGTALDIAGGRGRHAFYMAQRNWQVTLLDASVVALREVRKKSQELQLPVHAMEMDMEKTSFQAFSGKYHLVMVFFYLHRPLFPGILDAIRPGGLLLYKTHLRHPADTPGTHSRPEFLLEPGECSRAFDCLEPLHYAEKPGARYTAEFVGRKPMSR
jgi:tellurite methyltransferase